MAAMDVTLDMGREIAYDDCAAVWSSKPNIEISPGQWAHTVASCCNRPGLLCVWGSRHERDFAD